MAALAVLLGVAGIGLYCVAAYVFHFQQSIRTSIKQNQQFDQAIEHQIKAGKNAKTGNYPAAIAECKLALQFDPNFDAVHYTLARMYRKQGQTALAITEYHEVIDSVSHKKDKTGAAWAHYELGGLLKTQRKTDDAKMEWQLAIDCSPINIPQQAGIYEVRKKAQFALAGSNDSP